ncbi:MAG: hypothetical protein WCS37_10065, partial [Chloroflexota bacterium]
PICWMLLCQLIFPYPYLLDAALPVDFHLPPIQSEGKICRMLLRQLIIHKVTTTATNHPSSPTLNDEIMKPKKMANRTMPTKIRHPTTNNTSFSTSAKNSFIHYSALS